MPKVKLTTIFCKQASANTCILGNTASLKLRLGLCPGNYISKSCRLFLRWELNESLVEKKI